MTHALTEALDALPERTLARLAGPIDAAGLSGDEPVAFAGHVRRQGERGLLVVTGRELVFAAETGRVDRTPLERLQLAHPRETILTVAPGEGGRVQDDFRPLTPASFEGVDWPQGILAVHPDAGPRPADANGRALALVLVILLVVAIAAAVLLLV